MRHARILRWGGPVLLAASCLATTGCIHNHYYGQAVPVCDPATGTTQYGAVCEVPAGGAVVSQAPGRTTTIGSPSRVVINSEPIGTRPFARGVTRFPWSRSPEQGLATTRVEGGLNDDTTTQ